MRAARQSGINIDRIDRVINARGDYITKAGAKKGVRYGLNNPGRAFASPRLISL